MKKFNSPILVDISDMAEGVYAASGSIPIIPVPSDNPPSTDGWVVTCEYRNHNSGSHSEVAIIAQNYGTKSGESITFTFFVRGFVLDTVKDSSGYPVSNVSETGFTIYREGHFNSGERIEFNIQITCKDSKYHGSVGQTGEYIPCDITCISLTTA